MYVATNLLVSVFYSGVQREADRPMHLACSITKINTPKIGRGMICRAMKREAAQVTIPVP